MASQESNLFEKLPDEVLQLIFAAIKDCKSLVHCMGVSKAFQSHASKVNALKISLPMQFSTYDQKLWNIYSMVKTFKAIESLIVCVGQPKKEPPASWARCMRYAEIGVAVEKFVFMAAKLGDFVEFDSSLGLRSQFSDDNVGIEENENVLTNKYNATTLKNKNKPDKDLGLLINEEIGFYNEEDERKSDINTIANCSSSRQEPKLGLDTIRTVGCSIRANETNLAPNLSIQDTPNTNTTLRYENNFEHEKGEPSERLDVQDCTEGQVSLCKTFTLPKQLQFNEENLHVPIINFHLKQVIAPSNDVLKRMVPVIVFAIVQGLDEFRDTIPNFIEKFVKLKRFVLVDVVESLTVHMREHQIQQVRTQRLETISKLISESIINQSNIKTNRKNEKYDMEDAKVENRTIKQISPNTQSSEVNTHVDEKNNLGPHQNSEGLIKGEDLNTVEDFKNAPLKLQIHEIISKNINSKLETKPSLFESGFQSERMCPEKKKIGETQIFQNTDQIIKSPVSSTSCGVCQASKSQRNYGEICWHHFPSSLSSSVPSINSSKSNTLSCDLPHLPHVKRLVGNWSCNDPSLKAWLKGKQSLASQEEISKISKVEMKEVESLPTEHNKIKNCTQTKTLEEIMVCQLHDDLGKQLLIKPVVTDSINQGTWNRTLLNSRVTFSNSHDFVPTKNNIGQITPRPTTSIMKKQVASKHVCMQVDNFIEDYAPKLNLWEKPLSFEGSSKSSGSSGSSKSSTASLKSSRSENLNLDIVTQKLPQPQTKPYGKKPTSFKKTKSLNDQSKNSTNRPLKYKSTHRKYKSTHRKYTSIKESKSTYMGKLSFKRGLQKETSKRREDDRASRIANSRRHGNNCQLKNDVWMEGSWTRSCKEENLLLLKNGEDNLKDSWNFSNKSSCLDDDIHFHNKEDALNTLEDVKGKKIMGDCFNDERTTSFNETLLENHANFLAYEQNKENYNVANNDIQNITTTNIHECEQLGPIAIDHNEQLNSIGFEGVVLVPYESDSIIVNNRLQGLCDLEDRNSQLQTPYHDTNFINIEDYPRADISASVSPRDDDISHTKVSWSRARIRERSGTRRFGRRSQTRSLWRENHAHAERERNVRRERLREGVQKRQLDIEQEALFFDISFWRSEQVITHNYVLSDVSMCIATHDAKPLTEDELEMLSLNALAGPLLVATITYVNEQIGSHNL